MAIQAVAIHKSYGETKALYNVDLTVHEGEFLTLLGPSGCGKTTLLRVIAGLESPDSGSIILDRKDITDWRANQRPINTVFQSYALFPHLNVQDNIAFGLRSRNVPSAEITRRVAEAVAMVRLDGLTERRTQALSGGQQQRVALARALVNEPRVLLLDEPMSALDANLRLALQVELRALHRRLGGTFILVTHDQDEALTVSDQIVVMNKGQIIQKGSPKEVYREPASQFVAAFLGQANFLEARATAEGLASTAHGVFRAQRALEQESATLCIRPEEVVFPVPAACPNRLSGHVREVIYRGDHQEVWLESHAFRLHVGGDSPVEPGQSIEVGLPPDSLRVLYA